MGGVCSLLVIALAAFMCLSGDVGGSNPVDIVRVEEDWRVEVGVPDSNSNAPQIISVVSPTGSTSGVHAVFELNHVTLPNYDAGGMQLQCWNGDNVVDHHNFPNSNAFSTSNENVTYTMSMTLNTGTLEFEVVDGQSSTWGNFGGQGYLKCHKSTSLTSLGSYSPDVSVENSRVGFAKHRVNKMALKEVRYYSDEGLVATDSTERVVHLHEGQ